MHVFSFLFLLLACDCFGIFCSCLPSIHNASEITDPLFSRQWHLHNPHFRGHDINILPVWRQGFFGSKNVTVCLLDYGVDDAHPDIAHAYHMEASLDLSPELARDWQRERHATRCAGQIVGDMNNRHCGAGLAPGLRLSNIRMLASSVTSAQESRALAYRPDLNSIYSCSWGPEDSGRLVEGPDQIILHSLLEGVLYGRGGLGSIYIFASGNGGKKLDHCNMDGFANSPFTFTIGAISMLDTVPDYMEKCPATLAVTYSSAGGKSLAGLSSVGGLGIATTEPQEKCTVRHGGTSAAAPLAAALFGLVLSIRPDLSWRDLQALTIASARPLDPITKSGYELQTGSGYSDWTGFGKLDAANMVSRSRNWTLMGPPTIVEAGSCVVNESIPVGTRGLQSTLVVPPVSDSVRLEWVSVRVNIHCPGRRRGDLKIFLIRNGESVLLLDERPHDIYRGKASAILDHEEELLEIPGDPALLKNERITFQRPTTSQRANGATLKSSFSPNSRANEWEFSYSGDGLKDWSLSTLYFYGQTRLAGNWSLKVIDLNASGGFALSAEPRSHWLDWTMYFWCEKRDTKAGPMSYDKTAYYWKAMKAFYPGFKGLAVQAPAAEIKHQNETFAADAAQNNDASAGWTEGGLVLLFLATLMIGLSLIVGLKKYGRVCCQRAYRSRKASHHISYTSLLPIPPSMPVPSVFYVEEGLESGRTRNRTLSSGQLRSAAPPPIFSDEHVSFVLRK